MDFDEIIDRRGTHSVKWDMMESIFGVPAETGIAMWVADMDFRPPATAVRAIQQMLQYGIFGYYGDEREYRQAIAWWMQSRHGWGIDPSWIFSTHGLVNGTALCVDTFTESGDGVVLFTPVYHAFDRILKASERRTVECPLAIHDGCYRFDFDAYDAILNGTEKMAILCSPHNPGGRVWTIEELRAVVDFCERHDLILVSDEIHHDLVMPGNQHTVMPLAAPDSVARLIMLTATTKTFNLAGAHIGNVIIADEKMRTAFAKRMMALGISPNSFGMFLLKAVYSPDGAAWVNSLMQYLDENRRLFDGRIQEIKGVVSMPLEATYLAWVSFKETGMTEKEIRRRIEQVAQIAVNHGNTFGLGGEGFHRFNLATPRSILLEALDRLQVAFES